MLVGDYFGYDHWRSPRSYGSCEQFTGAGVTAGTMHSASYWSCSDEAASLDTLTVRPQAGFTDGRVETYSAQEVVALRVILDVATGQPYPDGNGMGPGVYYVPRSGL